MLHAIIRTPSQALHLTTPVNAYNMETLRWHVSQMATGCGETSLTLDMDSSDVRAFCQYARDWLPRMTSSGALRVETVREDLESLRLGLDARCAGARGRRGNRDTAAGSFGPWWAG